MSDTNWLPELSEEGPRYRALADAISEAIADGDLAAGVKLPPVRDLAWRLKVTPGTVARAYQLAEHRGLLEGQVGRGTFVRRPGEAAAPGHPLQVDAAPKGTLDFRLNRAPDVGQAAEITAAMERLIARHGALPITDYHRHGRDLEERAAGVDWLASGGVSVDVADLLICSGAQHGILTALATTVGGGDAIALTEPLIHPGLKDCARALGVRLEPVESDEEGLTPDALDAACARFRPGAVVLTANYQNPLLTTMPLARREAIAEVARRRRIAIIEDDVYGWLATDRAPSFVALAPELTWYVSSFSKCVAAGLRAGFVACPPGDGARGARILQSYTHHVPWMVSALTAELIQSGDAWRIVERVRAETAARATMMMDTLGDAVKADPASTFGWLRLPEPWRASDFIAALEARHVLASAAEVFAVGRAPAPHAVRIGLGHVDTRDEVAQGVARIAATLRDGPPPAAAVA